jgi:hypothetical protein
MADVSNMQTNNLGEGAMKLVRVGIGALALMICGPGQTWSNESGAPLKSGNVPSLAPTSEATVAGNVARNLVHVTAATVRYAVGGVLQDAGQYRIETTPATTSVVCPASPAGKCVVTANITVQLAGSVGANAAHLCFLINNQWVAPQCPYVGLVPSTSTYQTFSFSFAKYDVAVGTHRLQSRLGFDEDTYVGAVHVQYDVYK